MVWRDSASDSGRLGSSDSPVRNREQCVENTFSIPDTIAAQNAAGGWNETDKAEGGPLWRQQHTWGSAESE